MEIKKIPHTSYIYVLMLIALCLPSCNTTKYLQGDEKILAKNKIEIKSNQNASVESELQSNLENLIIQKPNEKFFGVDKSYYYFTNDDLKDTLWYNNFFREKMGEVPAIYSDEATANSSANMVKYLRNKRGFYNASVEYKVNESKYLKEVIYMVDLNPRYKIGSIEYVGTDTALINVIKESAGESLLKIGTPIDESLFINEKSRVVNKLQNLGYANFVLNYINILGDSTNLNQTVDIFFEILPPASDSIHRVYNVGDIEVFTDFYRGQKADDLSYADFNKKKYYKQNSEFIVKPRILDQAIFIDEDQLFSKDLREKTFRKLAKLGTYRFVAVNPVIRPDTFGVIDYEIMLSPYEHLWEGDYNTDIFYATLNQSKDTKNRLAGISFSTLFKNKNLLGGAEQFSVGTETGVELELKNPLILRTLTLSIDNALKFPRQLDLFGFSNLVKFSGLLNDKTYKSFKEETETTIGAGISHIDIRNFYSISTIRANYSYIYQPQSTTKFIIRQVGLDLNLYDIKSDFQIEIANNPLLEKSFQNNLLTGYLFRDISYLYSSPVSRKNFNKTYILNFEVSGWETYLLNETANLLSGQSTEWKLNDNVDFSKYYRLSSDLRFYKHFSSKHSLAARIFSGAIIPFGNNPITPFIRQFSVGGPNSLRAWNQKELGPGGYDSREEYIIFEGRPYYQQGDLRLELNLEYRFDLFWYLEGALFADAGNVWNLKTDPLRPYSKISDTFYDEIALGIGYGIRFDFDYFIIRFDFGYKVRNPYHIEGVSNWSSWDNIKSQKFGNFQVAVNYPF